MTIRYSQLWCMNVDKTEIQELLTTGKSGFDSKQVYKRQTT